MPEDTYEILYFDSWALVDTTKLVLEIAGAKYEHVSAKDQWASIKSEQRFGKVPRLTIKSPNGTVKHIWESSVIDMYLGEKLGLLPSDLFEKADLLSIFAALNDLRFKIAVLARLPVEQRGDAHEKHITETIPADLAWHEALLEKSSGTFYNGDKVSLPDLVLFSLHVMFEEMYGDRNPTRTFPHIMTAVNALMAGKAGDYVRERRKIGTFGWDNESLSFKS